MRTILNFFATWILVILGGSAVFYVCGFLVHFSFSTALEYMQNAIKEAPGAILYFVGLYVAYKMAMKNS